MLTVQKGEIPEVHIIRHLDCLGTYALGYLTVKGHLLLEDDITDEDIEVIQDKLQKAYFYCQDNPRQLLPKHARKEKHSRRFILRDACHKQLSGAQFHKQYTSFKTHVQFIAQKQAEADNNKTVTSLEKKYAAAEKQLEIERDKNRNLQKDLNFEIEEGAHVQQLMVNKMHQNKQRKFL